MDIIRLYEAKKPYHPKVNNKLEEAYTLLKERGIGMAIICSVFAVGFAITSRKRSWKEIGMRSFGVGMGAMVVHECYLWNNYLAKLYLVQKQKVD